MSSVTYGAFDGSCPSGFAGTSAASPTTVGAAALVRQANPSFKAPQLQAFLEQKAVIDLGTPGVDDQTGAGGLRPAELRSRRPARSPRRGLSPARAFAATT